MTDDKVKLLSLNVNSIRTDHEFNKMAANLGKTLSKGEHFQECPDIAFLQEHWLDEELCKKRSKQWKEWGGSHAFFAPGYSSGQQTRGGVAILLGDNPIFEISSDLQPTIVVPGRAMYIPVKIHGKDFILCAIYAPNDNTQRTSFFELLDEEIPKDTPVIWGGDFNCVEDATLDRYPPRNGQERGSNQIKAFNYSRNLVDPLRFKDPTKQLFTYTRSDSTGISTHRLDRIYIPIEYALNAKYGVSPTPYSDHNGWKTTIYLRDSQSSRKRGPGLFRMNTRIFEMEGYQDDIEQIAQDCQTNRYVTNAREKLDTFKMMLQHHAIECAIELKARDGPEYKEALKNYDREQHKRNPDRNNIQRLETILLEKTQLQTDKLLLQTKTDRLELDEKPTAYFYNSLKARHKKSTIEEVFTGNPATGDRTTTKNPTKVMEKILEFYQNLYDAHEDETEEDKMREMINLNDKKIPADCYAVLEAPLTLAELKAATKTMQNNKSPGEDGIPYEFYKKYGDIILPLVLEAAQEGHYEGQLSETQRNAVLTLLHKKGDRENLANWRPISLLCCDYKIIAKALAMRLIPALQHIIHEDQTCGVPGRTISNNTWLIRDLIDKATEDEQLSIMFSLDLEKAFDRVSHKFMIKALEAFGFGPNFCKWIKTLYNGCRTFVQNNGNLSQAINIMRGIRQGCPISIFLFVITAELLGIAIRKNTSIKGLNIPCPANKEVKLSQYADDTGAMILATDIPRAQRAIDTFYEILKLYEKASGAKLNFSKCKALVFGGRKDTNTNSRLMTNEQGAQYFNNLRPNDPIKFTCFETENGTKVLGIIYHPNPTAFINLNMNPIVDKVAESLKWSSMRTLSILGKVQTINTKALSKVWYVATTVPLTTNGGQCILNSTNSSQHINKLNTLVSEFLWKQRTSRINLEVMAQPKEKGGLGLSLIWKKALALRGRQFQQILNFDDNSPSALMGRYYLARKINNIIPWVTNELSRQQYTRGSGADDTRIGSDHYLIIGPHNKVPPDNKGYEALKNLFNQLKDCFRPGDRNPPPTKKLPAAKKLYQTKLDPRIRPASEAKWRQHNMNIPWENSFRTLEKNQYSAYTFKLRHRVLIVEAGDQATCRLCTANQPESHLHIFGTCTFTKNVWRIMRTSLSHINGNHDLNGPPTTGGPFLGVEGTNKRSRLVNTMINCTNAAIWMTRNDKRHNRNTTQNSTGTAKVAIKLFKETLKHHLAIAKKNGEIEKFKERVIYPSVATINRDSLIFHFPNS
jgi:exonuclease III